jgi:excisionase family DNA binding protein
MLTFPLRARQRLSQPVLGCRITNVTEDQDTAQVRVTIQEAARRLGVKEDAIRKRIQRGTLAHEKTEEGRVFAWIEATQDAYRDAGRDELRDQERFLREELARKDAILLRMAESIPQLEASKEAPESSSKARAEEEDREKTPKRGSTPQEPLEKSRSWWQRVFGG